MWVPGSYPCPTLVLPLPYPSPTLALPLPYPGLTPALPWSYPCPTLIRPLPYPGPTWVHGLRQQQSITSIYRRAVAEDAPVHYALRPFSYSLPKPLRAEYGVV